MIKQCKANEVAKEFYGLYRAPPVSNTFYLRNDKTFDLEPGVNLMQGRAVFRDDLLNRGGEQYSTWVQLDFDQKKDSYGNYKTRQFSEGYGFELKKELDKYEIKELYQKDSAERLTAALENGSRPVVTVMGRMGSIRTCGLRRCRNTGISISLTSALSRKSGRISCPLRP